MKRMLVIIAIAFCLLTIMAPDAWARGRMSGYESGCRSLDSYECCHDGMGCHGANCYDCCHHRVGYRRSDCYDYRGTDCYEANGAGVRTYNPVVFETVRGEAVEIFI